jgi:hypothetical protein
MGFMLAHPSDKNKDVARVGHPDLCDDPEFGIEPEFGNRQDLLVRDLL